MSLHNNVFLIIMQFVIYVYYPHPSSGDTVYIKTHGILLSVRQHRDMLGWITMISAILRQHIYSQRQ